MGLDEITSFNLVRFRYNLDISEKDREYGVRCGGTAGFMIELIIFTPEVPVTKMRKTTG
jgi:hypothetical protein